MIWREGTPSPGFARPVRRAGRAVCGVGWALYVVVRAPPPVRLVIGALPIRAEPVGAIPRTVRPG